MEKRARGKALGQQAGRLWAVLSLGTYLAGWPSGTSF